MEYVNDQFDVAANPHYEEADGIGTVIARVAQLDVVNANRRLLVPGGMTSQGGVVSRWNHDSAPQFFGGAGNRPVGRASYAEQDGFLVATMQFNLRTADGRDAYEYLSFMKDTRYSIGYIPTDATKQRDAATGRTYSRVAAYQVFENSPVILPASPKTGTVKVDNVNQTKAGLILARRRRR